MFCNELTQRTVTGKCRLLVKIVLWFVKIVIWSSDTELTLTLLSTDSTQYTISTQDSAELEKELNTRNSELVGLGHDI